MAVWQFKVEFIPKDWLFDKSCSISDLLTENSYDTQPAWMLNQPKMDLRVIISKYFPPAKSWHQDLFAWGNEDKTDVQLWYENGNVESLLVRMDLSENVDNLSGKVISLADEVSCCFFIPEAKEIIDCNAFKLQTFANNSNAAKFVRNPRKYLSQL